MPERKFKDIPIKGLFKIQNFVGIKVSNEIQIEAKTRIPCNAFGAVHPQQFEDMKPVLIPEEVLVLYDDVVTNFNIVTIHGED